MRRKLSEHFYGDDFICHCGKCQGSDPNKVPVDGKLVHEIELIQRLMPVRVIILAGYRCSDYNSLLTGKSFSEHTRGNAAHLSVEWGNEFAESHFMRLIGLCWNNNVFRYVCVFPSYIHVDVGHVRSITRENKSDYRISHSEVTIDTVQEKILL